MKILICSIFRNSETNLDLFYEYLARAVQKTPGVEFFFSAYENDSKDNTATKLHSMDWKSLFGSRYHIQTEEVGTKWYCSSTESDRVRNLANARNKALFAKDFYLQVDYVLQVESDVSYKPSVIRNLVNFQKKHSLDKVDIVSAASVASFESDPVCRDIWATRRTSGEEWGDFHADFTTTPYGKYWSTFNGLILYKADAFKKGLEWSAWNPRLEKWDCDTAVICENFRKFGYDSIYIDHTQIITHWKQGFGK